MARKLTYKFNNYDMKLYCKDSHWWMRSTTRAIVLPWGVYYQLGGAYRPYLRTILHEIEHLKQIKEFGVIGFYFRYLVEWVKNGYYDNKYEVEARSAEVWWSTEWDAPKLKDHITIVVEETK